MFIVAIVVGDPRVGKTTLVRKICNSAVVGKILPTVGIEFQAMSMTYKEREYRIKFWDLCTCISMQLARKNT